MKNTVLVETDTADGLLLSTSRKRGTTVAVDARFAAQHCGEVQRPHRRGAVRGHTSSRVDNKVQRAETLITQASTELSFLTLRWALRLRAVTVDSRYGETSP